MNYQAQNAALNKALNKPGRQVTLGVGLQKSGGKPTTKPKKPSKKQSKPAFNSTRFNSMKAKVFNLK